MTDATGTKFPTFTEYKVERDKGSLYVRDFPGNEPAFVLLHGFPDNLHIYDDLIPHLVKTGRRVVAFDFLGFGASDKLEGARYSFDQQLGDMAAVVDSLGLLKVIPVGHDAGGPTAVNYSLRFPEKCAAVVLMNAFYGEAPGLRVPEFIELFANKSLNALSQAIVSTPQQFAWLLNFQREQMQTGLSDKQKAHYNEVLGPIIDGNFRQRPSAGPAFAQMTHLLFDEVAANTARITDFRRSAVPISFVWGKADPYLHTTVAEYMKSQALHATLHVLEAGHWPQIDEPAAVADILLAMKFTDFESPSKAPR
jgi:pimeloyl-ACP methyl ester carboxylesterase